MLGIGIEKVRSTIDPFMHNNSQNGPMYIADLNRHEILLAKERHGR